MDDDERWFHEPSRAGSAAALPIEGRFVLEVRIVEGGGAAAPVRRHHLVVGPDGHRYHDGAADDPDAWLTVDRATAAGLRAGTVATAVAVQTGQIRVGGDLAALLATLAALEEVVRRIATAAEEGS